MIVLLMEVHVKPERRAEFIELIRDVASSSERDEEGCLRFDVLQDDQDETVSTSTTSTATTRRA